MLPASKAPTDRQRFVPRRRHPHAHESFASRMPRSRTTTRRFPKAQQGRQDHRCRTRPCRGASDPGQTGNPSRESLWTGETGCDRLVERFEDADARVGSDAAPAFSHRLDANSYRPVASGAQRHADDWVRMRRVRRRIAGSCFSQHSLVTGQPKCFARNC